MCNFVEVIKFRREQFQEANVYFAAKVHRTCFLVNKIWVMSV